MAKSFNQVYVSAKETAYADATLALPLLAAANKTVTLSPVFKSNGVIGTTSQYNIQRLKRGKVKAVANANANTTASALAILDSFQTLDWETVSVATGVKKSIGLKLSVNEEFDINSVGDANADRIATDVKAVAVERAESLLTTVIGASASVEFDDTSATPIQWLDEIDADVLKLQTMSDDFKHGTQNMIMVMHPKLIKMLSRVVGTQFQNEAAIFGTGLGSKFSYNGMPIVEDVNLSKTFSDGAATPKVLANKIGYVLLDVESIYFEAANETPIDYTLADTRFVGQTFYEVGGVIDNSRIIVRTSKTGFGTAMKLAKA